MRALRWPLALPRPSFEWLGQLGTRRTLLYVLYTLVLFVIFLIVNFPHHLLIDRALERVDLGPVDLDVADTRFAWWRGYELRDVSLRATDTDLPALIESPRVYVRPALGGLVRGELRSIAVSGTLYGGQVEANFDSREGTTNLRLRLRNLQIAQHPLITQAFDEGDLGGRLSGAVTIENRRGDLSAGQAAGELELTEASLSNAKARGFVIPDLHFPSTRLKFTARGGRLEIQELRADGAEVKGEASGQITLRDALPESTLNLKVSLQPGPAGSAAIGTLLGLIPRGRGARPDAPFTVTGTLAQPRVR
jgi:type II secretion system protein N